MDIGKIEKNSRDEIRVAVSKFKGHRFVDLRIYYRDAMGEYHPSLKGITLSIQTIYEVIDLLKKGAKKLENGDK